MTATNILNKLRIAVQSSRRESANGYGYAASWFFFRFYYRVIRRYGVPLPAPTEADRQRALTVLVPATEKDTTVLPLCLRAIKGQIKHRLAAVLVVAPESSNIRQIATEEGCQFVHEDELLPKPACELRCRGWMLQQLIKLNAYQHISTEDYLVVDSDTIFLRPQTFFRSGKSVLRYSDQYELLYNRSLELIFKHKRRFPVSFVTHHMLFNAQTMRMALEQVEQSFNRPWHEAILSEVDQGHPISFSEYELYGHFVISQPDWRRRFVLEYWHGLDQRNEDLPRFGEFQSLRKLALNSVSFHKHTQ